jgi:hypothetical protein
MSITRNKLYIILLISCLAGYTWVFINLRLTGSNDKEIVVCLIKHVTNVPCPSCGATRSIISFFNGSISDAFYWNPIGLILAIIMMVTPIWIAYDFIRKKKSLYIFYRKTELAFQQKKIAIPAIILVIGNWIWNIIKDV